MTNRYRPISVVGKATYGEDEFDAALSPVEELDALSGGHLELVPRTYRVLSDNYTAADQGETFLAVYPVENEAALISGGHIERVEPDSTGDTEPESTVDGTAVSEPKPKRRN